MKKLINLLTSFIINKAANKVLLKKCELLDTFEILAHDQSEKLASLSKEYQVALSELAVLRSGLNAKDQLINKLDTLTSDQAMIIDSLVQENETLKYDSIRLEAKVASNDNLILSQSNLLTKYKNHLAIKKA